MMIGVPHEPAPVDPPSSNIMLLVNAYAESVKNDYLTGEGPNSYYEDAIVKAFNDLEIKVRSLKADLARLPNRDAS
jgi:hypothetical protein